MRIKWPRLRKEIILKLKAAFVCVDQGELKKVMRKVNIEENFKSKITSRYCKNCQSERERHRKIMDTQRGKTRI